MSSKFQSMFSSKESFLTLLLQTLLLVTGLYGLSVWFTGTGQGSLFLLCFCAAPFAALALVTWSALSDKHAIGSHVSFQARLSQLQQRLNAQDDFFQTIANCTPSALTIFTKNNEYWFVNASAAAELGKTAGEIVGKKPVELLGGDRGRKIEKDLDQVKASNDPLETLTQETDGKTGFRYAQTTYYPIAAFGEFPGGVMARDENITTVMIERERREHMLRQTISTLVAVVDRRDPYASGHSARVGQLSRALAVELHLTEREIDAAEIAGSLMNFGKVLVSRAILTKTGALTTEELQRIRDSIMTSADILSMIDFGIPVIPTLRQVLERFDGTGAPQKLQGESILITARIVTLANAFVALVSPRAYRPGIDFSVAAQNLVRDSGTVFDPRVITALQNFLKKNAATLNWLTPAKPAA